MIERYQALVVGGGPCGSAAARVLASRGVRTALLDRACFPRPKLCGGLLTWKTVRQLEAVFGLDEAGLERAGLVECSADSYTLHHLGREISRDRGIHPFLLTDRTRLDHHLLRLAEEAGAEVMTGTGAANCSPGEGVVATVDGREIRADWIIGADGANSRMRRALPADRTSWYRGLARAVELHLPRAEAPEALAGLAEPQLHVGYIRAGYGWVFPGSDRLCIGMCGLERKRGECAEQFGRFADRLGMDPRGAGLKAHPLPYGNWLWRPGRGRLLLAGDAAGLVEPLLGEGIFYALTSGRYAAEAVAGALAGSGEGDPQAAYRKRLERFLVPELRGADRLRGLLLTSLRLAGYGPFGLFMRLAASPLAAVVHGRRSWRFMRAKTWDF